MYTFFLVLVVAIVLYLIRLFWTEHQLVKWIEQDVDDYEKHSPSFVYVLLHFWIWDMKKFGKTI